MELQRDVDGEPEDIHPAAASGALQQSQHLKRSHIIAKKIYCSIQKEVKERQVSSQGDFTARAETHFAQYGTFTAYQLKKRRFSWRDASLWGLDC